MDVDVIEEADNPMLHRTDVRFEVTHEEATPSRLSVRDSLAAMLNKDATEVVVHELDTKFGMRTTVGYAKVYETPEHAQDVEQDYMLRRNKIGGNGELEDEEAAETAEEAAETAEETAGTAEETAGTAEETAETAEETEDDDEIEEAEEDSDAEDEADADEEAEEETEAEDVAEAEEDPAEDDEADESEAQAEAEEATEEDESEADETEDSEAGNGDDADEED